MALVKGSKGKEVAKVQGSDAAKRVSARSRKAALRVREDDFLEVLELDEARAASGVRRVPPGVEDDDFWGGVFDRIRSGVPVKSICREGGYALETMLRRLHSDRLSGRYVAAHEGRAVMHVQKIEGMLDDLESGRVDADVARVSIDARKWLATKYYPRMFGERQQIDVKTVDMTKVYVEQLKEVMRRQDLRMKEVVSERVVELPSSSEGDE